MKLEIPSGKECDGDERCPFFRDGCLFDDGADEPIRLNPTCDEEDFYWPRSAECIATYPYGATVEIKPKVKP